MAPAVVPFPLHRTCASLLPRCNNVLYVRGLPEGSVAVTEAPAAAAEAPAPAAEGTDGDGDVKLAAEGEATAE